MFHVRARSAHEWGDLVRGASRHSGPWPRVSVWHGGSDPVVKPENADQIVKQWIDVHGLDHKPTVVDTVDGYPRQVWRNRAGDNVVESYTITCMAHGTPLETGGSDKHCGVPGAFLLDVGISSSYHIAKFWGLTEHSRNSGGLFARLSANPARTASAAQEAVVEPDLRRRSGTKRSPCGQSFARAAVARLVKRLRRYLPR